MLAATTPVSVSARKPASGDVRYGVRIRTARLPALDYCCRFGNRLQTTGFVEYVNTGLAISIVSAKIATDGTISVDYKLADPSGLPLDQSSIYTPGIVSLSFLASYIPNGQSQYTSYITRAATAASGGATPPSPPPIRGASYRRSRPANTFTLTKPKRRQVSTPTPHIASESTDRAILPSGIWARTTPILRSTSYPPASPLPIPATSSAPPAATSASATQVHAGM
jgi:hypothetical protein